MWKDERLVHMISTVHDATIMNTGRKGRKTNLEIQKLYAFFQYNKFTKGIDREVWSLSYYRVLRKVTIKWSKASAKLCTLRCIFVFKTLNTH